MRYRIELLLGCIGLNFVTDLILWTYSQYTPHHVGVRVATYSGILLIAWLLETRDRLFAVKGTINRIFNAIKDRRHKSVCKMIREGEVRGKAKVIRINSHRA
jgi:hypothetical protein